eukprot:PhF_6_TR593/c1_g1_i3/m.674
MSDSEQENKPVVDELKATTAKQQQILKEINARRLKKVLSETPEPEKDRVKAKVFRSISKNGTSIGVDDVLASTKAYGCEETPEAAQVFLEFATNSVGAESGAGLSFEGFLLWWASPSVGSKCLPVWKARLRQKYYAEVEKEDQVKPSNGSPFQSNPAHSALLTIGNIPAGVKPPSHITATAVPMTKASFLESVKDFEIPAEDEESKKIPRLHAVAAVDLKEDVTASDVSEVLEMFNAVLEEVGKEHPVFTPSVAYDKAKHQFLFNVIARESSDPLMEALFRKIDKTRAEFVGGEAFHGAVLRLGFFKDLPSILNLKSTEPVRSILDSIEIRGHVVAAQKFLRTIFLLFGMKTWKKITRNRESKIVEHLVAYMVAQIFSGVVYRGHFDTLSDVITNALKEVEVECYHSLAMRVDSDEDVEKIKIESQLIREKLRAYTQRMTRHDAAVIDFFPFLNSKFSMEKFLGGRLTKDDDRRLIFLGPSGTGKTVMLYALKLGETISTIPTVGFNVETVKINSAGGGPIAVWDLGGDARLIPLWRHYIKGEEGETVVFFVNGSRESKQSPEEVKAAANSVRDLGCSRIVFLVTHDGTNTLPKSKLWELLEIPEEAADVKYFEIDIRTAPQNSTELVSQMLKATQMKDSEDKDDKDPDEPQPTASDILDGADEVMTELLFRLRGVAKSISKVSVSSHYARLDITLENIGLLNAIPESPEALNEAYQEGKRRATQSKMAKTAVKDTAELLGTTAKCYSERY